jgi:NAD(P)-dependent dehydrogenase (short-subunit alcohol dehydrogenase family)
VELTDKVAIVTGAGGAGVGGLGVVYAQALASQGADLIVADIDGGAARSIAETLVADGHRAIGVKADVTVEADIEAMVAAATEAFGGVDILVNNAGLARGKWSEAVTLSADEWMHILAVNTAAPALCARACRESMSQRGGGCIVNQASMAAYTEAGAYSVSKLALVSLTKVLAAELAGDNIRVNAIAPGMMTAKLPPDHVQRILDTQLIRRLGTPEDLIGALLYFCSSSSSFVTAQTLIVDGGSVRGRV